MKIETLCVVLGGNDSLLPIALPFGFTFKRMQISETTIDGCIHRKSGELLPQYVTSNLSGDLNQPEYICLYKNEETGQTLREYKDSTFHQIEEIISLLQLLKPSSLTFSEVFCILEGRKIEITVIADVTGVIGSTYIIMPSEISSVDGLLRDYHVEYSKLFDLIAAYFNSSKFVDRFMQMQYLMTIGEMLVLKNHEKTAEKKEPLAQRLSVLIGKDDIEVQTIYSNIKEFYDLRSKWTHRGNASAITYKKVIIAREIIATSILEYLKSMKVAMVSNPSCDFVALKKTTISALTKKVNQNIAKGLYV